MQKSPYLNEGDHNVIQCNEIIYILPEFFLKYIKLP